MDRRVPRRCLKEPSTEQSVSFITSQGPPTFMTANVMSQNELEDIYVDGCYTYMSTTYYLVPT